jgi:hypothetical protein
MWPLYADPVECDHMGTLVDERDRLLYSFFSTDQIWD